MSLTKRKKYYRNDDFLKRIGFKIREVRVQKGLTQEELAFECDYADFSQINRIELGKVNFSISYLQLIAEKLDISVKDLLD
ncbi:MAG: helix-turn-helix transcriptional regulator [Ferruginibacter sp.]|nr:helix-turn-helix transcriptional regulator [Ferruginibacter sp.]